MCGQRFMTDICDRSHTLLLFGICIMLKLLALQAVTAIVHIAEARQLATLCDGALQLLDQESLEGKHVPGPKVCSPWPRASRMSPCTLASAPLQSCQALSVKHVAAVDLPQRLRLAACYSHAWSHCCSPCSVLSKQNDVARLFANKQTDILADPLITQLLVAVPM